MASRIAAAATGDRRRSEPTSGAFTTNNLLRENPAPMRHGRRRDRVVLHWCRVGTWHDDDCSAQMWFRNFMPPWILFRMFRPDRVRRTPSARRNFVSFVSAVQPAGRIEGESTYACDAEPLSDREERAGRELDRESRSRCPATNHRHPRTSGFAMPKPMLVAGVAPQLYDLEFSSLPARCLVPTRAREGAQRSP